MHQNQLDFGRSWKFWGSNTRFFIHKMCCFFIKIANFGRFLANLDLRMTIVDTLPNFMQSNKIHIYIFFIYNILLHYLKLKNKVIFNKLKNI